MARVVPGCDDPRAGEAAAPGVFLGGGVVGGGARPPDDRGPGAGAAGAGDAGPAVTLQPDEVPFRQSRRHAAAPALPGDQFHVAAEPDGHTAGRSRAQRRLPGYPVGVRQPRQRAAPHPPAGGRQTVRTIHHLEPFAVRQSGRSPGDRNRRDVGPFRDGIFSSFLFSIGNTFSFFLHYREVLVSRRDGGPKKRRLMAIEVMTLNPHHRHYDATLVAGYLKKKKK